MANFVVPYEEAVKILVEKLNKTKEEIERIIEERREKLANLVSKEGIANIMLAEIGYDPDQEKERIKISNLREGMSNVEVIGKVIRKFEIKEFEKESGKGYVGSFILADETGTVRVVAWNDHAYILEKIKEGDVIVINRGYVKLGNRNRRELHLSERSQVEINPPGIEIETIYEKKPERKKIKDLQEGDVNVEIIATVVQVLNPKIIGTCPICDSIVRISEEGDYVCRIHGVLEEKPKETYVLNIFVDDGTASARVVFWREQVEKFLQVEKDEIIKFANYPETMKELKTDLLAKIVRIVGNVKKNRVSGGLDVNVNDFEFLEELPKEEEGGKDNNFDRGNLKPSYLEEENKVEEEIDIEDIDI